MKNNVLRSFLVFSLLLLASCTQTPEPEETPSPTVTPSPVAVELPTTEPSETPLPTPTPRPTNTPMPAALSADYQVVQRDGILKISDISIPVDGWLVVYPERRGTLIAEDALGFIPVESGQASDLEVEINPQWPEQSVQLALHGGRDGADDSILTATADNLLLIQSLTVDTQATLPQIELSNQDVLEDGLMIVDRVKVNGPGWIAVFPSDDGDRERLLGYAPLQPGEQEEIPVVIRWREAPSDLTVVVLDDLGRTGVFEPDVDLPITILDDELRADLTVIYPPDIVIFNQPVINSQIVVERAATPVDGWIVIYEDSDEDNQPGFIIGSARIEQGVNEYVEVEVNETAVADQLLVTFHEDTGVVGEFDFPGADPPQRYQQQAFFTPFRTDQGSVIMTLDQPIIDGEVRLPMVIAERDIWIAVYEDEDGQPGAQPLGFQLLSEGVFRDVVIELEESPSTPFVHVVMHSNNGLLDEFEPDLTDFPLQFNRRNISAVFKVLP